MAALPELLADRALDALVHSRHPAWLQVDASGNVLDSGGELARYGIEATRPDTDATELLPFLADFVPPPEASLAFPLVPLPSGRVADAQLIPHDAGAWLLLLDAADAAPASNESEGAGGSMMPDAPTAPNPVTFGATTDVLVLERVSPKRFRPVGDIPKWASDDVEPGAELDPAELSSFLEAFLPDAERIWRRTRAGVERSGPWCETWTSGQEVLVEAAATQQSDGAFLLIAPVDETFYDKQRVLQEARERSLDLDYLAFETQRKDVLLHCLVHDLTGPLTSIVGSLGFLEHGDIPAETQQRVVALARRAAKRQQRMIRNILHWYATDLAELSSTTEGIEADVAFCARRVLEEFMPAFAQAGVSLRMSSTLDFEAGIWVVGEEERLGRVFANLLDNARRHTPDGGSVTFSVGASGGTVIVDVDNDGPAVPKELRGRLFDKYARTEGGGDAGLGLFYCKLTLEAWGGEISYERVGDRSRFRCLLRAAR